MIITAISLILAMLFLNRTKKVIEYETQWPTTGDTVEYARAHFDPDDPNSLYGLGVKLYYDDPSTQVEGVDLIQKAADLDLKEAKEWLLSYKNGENNIDFEKYRDPK